MKNKFFTLAVAIAIIILPGGRLKSAPDDDYNPIIYKPDYNQWLFQE
jgi:hypothetical protein